MKTTKTNVKGIVVLALTGAVAGLSLCVFGAGKDDNRSLIIYGGLGCALSLCGLPVPVNVPRVPDMQTSGGIETGEEEE